MALDAATRQKIKSTYPGFAYLLDIPEIGELLGRAATEGWDVTRLQGQLYATRWWKTHSQTQRNWETLRKTDPAEAQRQRQTRHSEIGTEVRRLGLNLSQNDIALIAERSLQEAWDPSRITQSIVDVSRNGGRGVAAAGDIRATSQDLKALAKQYAVTAAQASFDNWAMMIASGRMTEEGIRAMFVEMAKRRVDPHNENAELRRALDSGLTVRDTYASVISAVAGELELDESAIDLSSGHWGKLLDFEDEKGRQRPMTQTEAIGWARNQSSWQKTNTAKESYAGLADAMTAKWGMR